MRVVHGGRRLRGVQVGRGGFVPIVVMMVMMVIEVVVTVVMVVVMMIEKTGPAGDGVAVGRCGTVIATGAAACLRLPAAERRVRGID